MSQTKEGFKKRILAVDDDIIVLTRITNILRNDYELVTVNSGMWALRYLREEKPDLILLDIRMAQQDGIETLREIRNMEERKDIPVIMLTGVENKDIVVESAKLGVCDYLLKPFSSTELLKRIQRVLGQEETEESYERERRIME